MDVGVLGMRFIFEDVIRRAKSKGHLDMKDARRLSETGIPIISICIKNTPIDNVEKYVDEWFNSLEYGKIYEAIKNALAKGDRYVEIEL